MNIFFPKEPEFETRVSLTLESAKKFLDKGLNISIEKSFAEHLGSSDKDFEDLGVKTLNRDEGFASAEVVCSVRMTFSAAEFGPQTSWTSKKSFYVRMFAWSFFVSSEK